MVQAGEQLEAVPLRIDRHDKPLRVAHIAHTVERGGAELALLKLLRSSSRTWDASVVIPCGDPGVFRDLPDDNVEIVHLGGTQAPGASGAGVLGMLRFGGQLLKQAVSLRGSRVFREADIVHANSTRAAVYSALACWASRKKLVVHLRDRIEPDAIGKFGYIAFSRIVVPRAQALIANSASTAETVRSMLGSSQDVEVIPSPIGVQRADFASRNSRSRISIGMVARLDPWKGQAELIEAFSIADIESSAELILIGDAAFGHEAYEKDLRRLVDSLGLTNVFFEGFRVDVQRAIDELDVCVQYSTRPEPLGQNVLQYLARAKPVIAAAEGGPTEWIRDGVNGLLVEPRNVDALAEALRSMTTDANARYNYAQAATRDDRLLSDEEVVLAHASLYAKLMDEH